MKKTMVWTALALSVTVLLGGCSQQEQIFTEKSYDADAEQVQEIRLDVRDRQVEVSPSPDGQIHLEYAESEKEYYTITALGETLTMTAAVNKAWTDYIGGKPAAENRKILLQIPDGLLKAVSISTTNEDIRLSGLTVTDTLALSVNGGDLTFNQADAEKAITLTAKNGDITGSLLGRYEDYAIACAVKKGESNLPTEKSAGDKPLSVSANNGDVVVQFQGE